MRVVLGEGTHPGQAGKHARLLETMQPAEVGKANRQIAVGIFARGEQIAMTRTVHRLHAVLAVVHVHQEHIVMERLVVSRRLPQIGLVDQRRHHLGVTVAAV